MRGGPTKKKHGARFFFAPCAAGGNSLTHWRIRGRVFFCSVRGKGKFTHSLAHPGARFFFCSVRGGGNSLTHWRVWFFFVVCAAGEIHSLTRTSGGAFFFLLCARRWTFTHSLARPGVIHSLTGACGGAFFFLLRARRGKFTHSLARPRLCVVGTEGAFFFCSARGGGNPGCAFDHSLDGHAPHVHEKYFARPCRFFMAKSFFSTIFTLFHGHLVLFHGHFTLFHDHFDVNSFSRPNCFFTAKGPCGRRTPKVRPNALPGFTPSLARLRLCVVEKAGAFFFLLRARQGEIHSLTGASGGAFFFCSVRGGGNSLTHWRVHGCVWFFFVVCAAGEIHSLTRASGGAFFLFAVCAAVDIHSLTGASGGDSLTHWRVRGRVFFFAPCAVGEIHSLTGASAAVCGWNRGRVFFFAPCAAGQAKKKHGARFFFCSARGGPSKKKNFF